MKNLSALLILSGLFTNITAQVPTFETGINLYDGTTPIDVGLYSAPIAYDWNGDFKKDLIVGQFDQGRIRYYENLGEDSNPAFSGFTFLQANSVTINLPYG